MHLRSTFLCLGAGLALALAGLPARAADLGGNLSDEQTLRAVSLTTDGPALLDFFRKRSQSSVDPAEVAALVAQLGDKSGEVREKATGALVALGPVAVPQLRQAAKDPDEPEVAGRAKRCLQAIEGNFAASVPVAAARLVAQRRPEGAAAVLLDYLPLADDENVVEEVKLALAAVAQHDGKPESVLLQALEDKSALRRAVAAEALCTVPGDDLRATVRSLLKDPRPTVSVRVALALATSGKDPKAVSTLIAGLADVPPAQAKQAEDYLLNLAGDLGPKVALGGDDASRAKARDAWAAWWLSTEGDAPLDEFTRRTLTDEIREKALGLIKQCGDDNFDVREKATGELQAMGVAIASILRQYANDPDLEISSRVQKCLQSLDKDKGTPLSPAVPRVVALRKPERAAEVMLAFLPFAEDEQVISEIEAALVAVGSKGGKADPALVRALDDKNPLRRAVAAGVLWQVGDADTRKSLRALLKDSEPMVRLRVALAMAGTREKEAVPVLIAVMTELPAAQGMLAEDYLRRVAGDGSPAVALAGDAAERSKCRDAWLAWWKANEATADLAVAAAPNRQLGYTMVLSLQPQQLSELGPDGKPRWTIQGFNYAYDAVALPGDRVLIAEYNNVRVSERNTKGETIWSKQLQWNPVGVQRLANGNTFIASNGQFFEVDKAGKEVSVINRPQGDIMAAYKTRDGQIVALTGQGTCIRMDATGKELKSFGIGGNVNLGGLELLANGRILVAMQNNNKVVEFDQDGKSVWEASVAMPSSACRLPNGNTLVASYNQMKLLELDRAGKVVSETTTQGIRPWKVRRR
jgi:HEAT repeat protein